MSSVTLKIEQSKSRFPFKTVGLALIALSLCGFFYAFYPEKENLAEIDLGSKLQTISLPASADNSLLENFQTPFLIKASLGQQPGLATQTKCAITGVPESVTEGASRHGLRYTCNNRPVSAELLSPRWSINAGTIDVSNPAILKLDTTGLGGQRVIVSATFKGCGQNLCRKRWIIPVAKQQQPSPQNLRWVVRVTDANGNGIAGASVTINNSTEQITLPNGVAQFTDLKPGKYTVSIVAEGFYQFTATHELTPATVLYPARLEQKETPSSESPTVSPTPPPGPSPSASAAAELSPPATPAPSVVDGGPIFAPGKNGSLSITWPTTVSSGWSNVCRIRYVPPPESPGNYKVEALFFLTSMVGFTGDPIRVPFHPLDQNEHEWEIPLEPDGPDGSILRAQLVMQVITGPQSSRNIDLQPFQSTIEDKPFTQIQSITGSGASGLFGVVFLGVGRKKRKDEKSGGRQLGKKPRISEWWIPLPPSPSVTLSDPPAGSIVSSVRDWVADKVSSVTEVVRVKRSPAEIEKPSAEVAKPTNGAHPPSPQVSRESAEVETTPPAESPRYVDVTIYEDHLFPSDDLDEAVKVPDDVPLIADKAYTLGVAIRLKRTGIASDRPAGRPVENPRQDEETLTIHVVATPLRGFKIAEPLVTIAWPYNADSESALFQLEFHPLAGGTPATVEIRILDHSLNLLDIVTLAVATVARKGDAIDPAVEPRRLTWADKEHEGVSLAGSSKPRLASIHVRPKPFGFEFDFLFCSAQNKAVSIPVYRNITSDDLNFLLSRVRDFWSRLVITNYATKLTVSSTTYDSYLRELRDLGIEAWSLLFDTRTADQEGASERMGLILSSLESEKASEDHNRIQVSYAADYGDFIFPWSILHPPVAKDTPVDPLRFWGARYQIEQVTKGPRKDRIDDRPINVLFALDSTFGDAPSQKKMFEDYQAAAQGELVVSSPIGDRNTLEELLIRDPSAHLLYFYCHGYAATRPGLLMADGVKSLKTIIEEIRGKSTEGDSPVASALEKLMELTSKMAGESWIYLGDAQVKEAELRLMKFFKIRRPIVFLNMCQSADLVPSMSSGLVNVFLDHNASAVVGTESPMTSVFADAFARQVFDRLFRGDDIGTALWKARFHFLTQSRNPLGLAYTLYGRADASLCSEDRPFVIPTDNVLERT